MAKVLQRLDILLFANTAQYRREMRETQESSRTMFQSIKTDAVEMGKVGAVAFAGLAAAGTAAIGVMIQEQVDLGNEIVNAARKANTSIKDIQKMGIGAEAAGIGYEGLTAALEDTQEAVGDFLSTGGGPMADFFENIAPQIGITAEEFRSLSGPDALQMYYDSIQKANISQSETIFYMKSISEEAASLIPYLHDGGAGFDVWYEAAKDAGRIMDEETIRATQELQATTDIMMLSYDGAQKQFTRAFIPVLSDVAGQLVSSGNAADFAREAGESLATGFKSVAKVGIGVSAVFDAVGSSIGGVAAIIGTLMDGVDFWDGGIEIAVKMARNIKAAGEINYIVDQDIRDSLADYAQMLDDIDALGTGQTNKFVATVMAQNQAQQDLGRTLGVTGQQYQAQQEAIDKHTESLKKAQKVAGQVSGLQINSAVKANAERYNFAALEAQYGLPYGLLSGIHQQESSGNTRAIGPATRYGTAKGGFQFIDDTAARYGVDDPFNMEQAAEGAAKYLQFLLNKFSGNVAKAVAAYNTGEGNVDKYDLSLILSDRWARNKKTGIGQTKEYTQNVLGYTQSVRATMGETTQFIYDSVAKDTQIAKKAAAEQQQILEQQAKDRLTIRMDYADEATRIEEQLKTDILKIEASGFSDDEQTAFIDHAIERANFKSAQLKLNHDQQMQYAQQAQQTDAERIRAQYALERREIEITVGMDEQLRRAKIDALNQAEQMALDERRYAFERELRDLTSIGQSELAILRQSYADQRRELELRTDISPEQKFKLYQGIDGAEKYDTGQLQDGARDAFATQQADFGGTAASFGIAQQYQARLDVISDALKAEVVAVEQAEQAKFDARREFETAATQLSLSQAEQTAGNFAASFKTMMGEQNTAYQIMFAAQQSFVMASAGLNMYEAWGDAMAEGATLTQKFAAAATIATEFGRIISAASSMTLELPGYRSGGYTGDAPEDQIVGYVHGREHVSDAATTKRYRPELEAMNNGTYERQSSAPNINVNVTVNSDGTSDVESNHKLGRQIGQGIESSIRKVLVQEKRPGGLLYA